MKNMRVLLSVFFLSLYSSVQCEDIQPPPLLVDGDWDHDDEGDDEEWLRRHHEDEEDASVEILL